MERGNILVNTIVVRKQLDSCYEERFMTQLIKYT